MTVHSFAKINLALIVKNKRPDGFHNIETIFTSVGLKDTLLFKKCDDIVVDTDNPKIPSGPANLAYKAAELVKKAFNVKNGVHIHIKKRIPSGAGLAGGSGNAAATVKGLIKFWDLKPDKKKIDRILKATGSDVPYCYYGGTMFGRGRGEKLIPLPPFKGYSIVLICPSTGVSTAWAYKNLKRNLTYLENKINLYLTYRKVVSGQSHLQSILHNDFEEAVFRKHPDIKKIRIDFKKLEADGSLMSGSGSTVVGFFRNHNMALKAATSFKKKGLKVFTVKPLHVFDGKCSLKV